MSAVDQTEYYRGVRMAPYDLVRELVIALGATFVLMVGLAAFLSSPDVKPETIQSWAQADPVDLVTTAVGELAGTSTSSAYGSPYNDGSASVQSVGFFAPQAWAGVHTPVDAAQDFVLQPLQQASVGNPALAAALAAYTAANAKQQQTWLDAEGKALKDAKVQNGQVVVATGDYGPLPTMLASYLEVARVGAIDGALLSNGHFYQTDYSRPLLFMGDGGYLSGLAGDQHLLGSQWGMMNETGNYPGQAWLWLYTLWYQVPPYSGAANADLLVVLTMAVLSLGLVLTPFIPIINRIPLWVPIYRLIWRRHYSES
ncbi:MAG TPA: hypothetical protein VIU62_15085 [Chloroflexota bacterium]